MWVAIAFLAWPFVEIGLFVTLGGAIGLWETLAIVLMTAVLGAVVVRGAARLSGATGLRDPRQLVLSATRGGMMMLAGVFLILPGFMTDVLGLILLIPPVQLAVTALLLRRIRVGPAPSRKAAPRDVIDGEFTHVAEDRPAVPSKWTQD